MAEDPNYCKVCGMCIQIHLQLTRHLMLNKGTGWGKSRTPRQGMGVSEQTWARLRTVNLNSLLVFLACGDSHLLKHRGSTMNSLMDWQFEALTKLRPRVNEVERYNSPSILRRKGFKRSGR